MISFILNYCYKIPKLTFQMDYYNNLFITKNTTNPSHYPCVLAHMDTVHTFSYARELVISNGVITARYIGSNHPCGLNADDCNGILVALQLLEKLPNLKVCFTTEEEIGAKGAEEAVNNCAFFEDVSFLMQADRRNADDLIVHTNGIYSATKEFVDDIKPIMNKYSYSEAYGLFTDVGVIADFYEISGVNVSCGYYHEHTNSECCVISELENCLNFMYEVINTLKDNGKVYTRGPEDYQNKYDSPYYNQRMFDYPREFDDQVKDDKKTKDPYELPCDHCSTFDCMNCTKYDY